MSEEMSLKEMLEGMKKAELVRYANMTFGLNVTAKLNRHDLIQQIVAASENFKANRAITPGDFDEDELQPGYATVMIQKTELNKKGRPVILGLNGKFASLPVGVPFSCPLEFVEILDNAKQIQYEQNPETQELEERIVHSYPFTVSAQSPHTPASKAAAAKMRGSIR